MEKENGHFRVKVGYGRSLRGEKNTGKKNANCGSQPSTYEWDSLVKQFGGRRTKRKLRERARLVGASTISSAICILLIRGKNGEKGDIWARGEPSNYRILGGWCVGGGGGVGVNSQKRIEPSAAMKKRRGIKRTPERIVQERCAVYEGQRVGRCKSQGGVLEHEADMPLSLNIERNNTIRKIKK